MELNEAFAIIGEYAASESEREEDKKMAAAVTAVAQFAVLQLGAIAFQLERIAHAMENK